MEMISDNGTLIKCPSCDFILKDKYRTHCPVDGEALTPFFQNIRSKRSSVGSFAQRFSDILPYSHSSSYRESESLKTPLIFVDTLFLNFDVAMVMWCPRFTSRSAICCKTI